MIRRTMFILLVFTLVSGQRCTPDDDGGWTPSTPDPRVTIQTDKGDIEIELFANQAPQSVENFLAYVHEGYYHHTIVHSVSADSAIKAGRFKTNLNEKPNRALVNESTNGLSNTRGRVALYGPAEVTEGVPFIHINVSDNTYLDYDASTGQKPDYTVIGRVISGMDIVTEISKVETEDKGSGLETAPKDNIEITGICTEPPCTEPADDPDDDDDGDDDDDDDNDDFITTDSGLKYKDVVKGDGLLVIPESTVVCYYTGRLNDENGDIFDTTDEDGQPRTFSLAGVIVGWQEGLGNYDMRVGGTRILIIPPELGYGESGAGESIPPNSTLWFEVQVLNLGS